MKNNKIFIGAKAPDFTAETTFGKISLSDFIGSWVVLFSHLGDFTPICTTEFIDFSKCANEFAKRNTQLLGISSDSIPSHLAWLYAIKSTTGITVPFPVISDMGGKISKLYNMNNDTENEYMLQRNVFIIDPDGIIRSILIYPASNGRNTEEILRILSALQVTDSEKMMTPVNWKVGDAPVYPHAKTYKELEINESESPDKYDCWYIKKNAESL